MASGTEETHFRDKFFGLDVSLADYKSDSIGDSITLQGKWSSYCVDKSMQPPEPRALQDNTDNVAIAKDPLMPS